MVHEFIWQPRPPPFVEQLLVRYLLPTVHGLLGWLFCCRLWCSCYQINCLILDLTLDFAAVQFLCLLLLGLDNCPRLFLEWEDCWSRMSNASKEITAFSRLLQDTAYSAVFWSTAFAALENMRTCRTVPVCFPVSKCARPQPAATLRSTKSYTVVPYGTIQYHR